MLGASHLLRQRLLSLNPDEFEQLVAALVAEEHADARRLAGAERGVDVIVPSAHWALQCKRFAGQPKWRDCEKSLADARAHYPELKRYTLVFVNDFNAAVHRTFEERLVRPAGDLSVDAWTLTELRNRLELHPRLQSLLPVAVGAALATVAPPAPSRHFDGRESLLARVRSELSDDTPCTVVLHGLGGVGKTQLAAAFTQDNRQRYAHTWWLGARGRPLVAAGARRIASDLRMRPPDDDAEVLAAARDGLAATKERWLLILDDATDPADVIDMLPAAPASAGHVLVTSVNPFWQAITDAAVEVPPLDRRASARVLAGRSGRDEPALADLGEDLGGLPLALEQVGAYLEQLESVSVQSYRSRLAERGAELLGRGPVPRGLRPVAAAWDLSMDEARRRHPQADRVLGLVAHLAPDRIPLDLLGGDDSPLSDDDQRDGAVAALRAFSLIGMHADGQAVRVHRLVQTICRNRLNRDGTLATAAAELVRKALPTVQHLPESWASMGPLADHAIAAADHVEALPNGADAAGLLTMATANWLRSRGRMRLALELFHRALAFAEPDDQQLERLRTLARRLNNVAAIHADLGRLADAERLHRRSLGLREAIFGHDDPSTAVAAGNLGGVLLDMGRNEEGLLYVLQAWESRSRLGDDDRQRGWSARDLADGLLAAGCPDQALAMAEEAVRILSLPPEPGEAESLSDAPWALVVRARAWLALGDVQQARRDADECLAGFLRLGEEHFDTAHGWVTSAEVAVAEGDLGRALAEAEHARGRLAEAEFEHPLHLRRRAVLAAAGQLPDDKPHA